MSLKIKYAIATYKCNKEQGCNFKAGLEKDNELRPVGDVLNEMFSSDSPLAKGYRKYLAAKENGAEKGDRL